MKTIKDHRPWPVPLLITVAVALNVVLAIVLFRQLMNPPAQDMIALASFLATMAAVALAAGYGAHRFGLINQSPRLGWALLGGYILSNLFAFLSVWIMARLMFVSQHDLILASVLLLFASGIAVALGYFLSVSITERIVSLNAAAARIAEGHLDARAEIVGQDEVADLARTFNTMAAQLEAADRKQRELDTLRRDLVAWVGHDLRTPLSSIRVIIEALADDVIDDPEATRRYLDAAQRDIATLSRLIDDLFEMAQIDAGGLTLERKPNSISDLISDTLGAFAAQAARSGVELQGHAEPGLGPIPFDAQQIGRVLSNLVENALRHTPPGGAVHVRAFASGAEVRIEISDTGEGIATEDLPRIFEQFYRGEKSRSRATGGAGLGLAIAKGIVEAHGGEIEVRSTPSQGATFSFTLPA